MIRVQTALRGCPLYWCHLHATVV